LQQDKQKGKPQHPEHLKIDPCVGIEVGHDVVVYPAYQKEEQRPTQV
jgi:hypothetical protein